MKDIAHKIINSPRFKVTCFIICFAFSSGFTGWNTSLGTLTVSPFVKLKQVYDSNVFLEPDGKEDHITILSSGAELELSSVRSELKLNYWLDRLQFWNNTQENITSHTVSAMANLRPSNDLQMSFGDTFERTADPATTELTERQKRISNRASLHSRYDLNKLSVELGYANIFHDYDDLDFLDRQEHVVSVATYYHYFREVPFLLQYDQGWLNYRKGERSDADYGAFWGGVQGKLNRKLSGEIKAGYLWRDYEQLNRDDFSGEGFYAGLRHDFSASTTLRVFAIRRLEESAYQINNYYLINGGGLELNRQLSHKFSIVVLGSYYINRYPTETTEGDKTAKREDDIFTGITGLSYNLRKWLAADLRYSFYNRSSNMEVFDFERHRISVEAALKF